MQSIHQPESFPTTDSQLPKTRPADEINEEHQLAQSCARDAVTHAVRCGEMLAAQKKGMPHGQFVFWIQQHCKFKKSTATRYMRAAKQKTTGVAFSNLSSLFPSGKKSKSRPAPPPKLIEHDVASAVADTGSTDFLDNMGITDTTVTGSMLIERAIEVLTPDFAQAENLKGYRSWHGKVARLRDDLKKAEAQLLFYERSLLEAAKAVA